MVERGNGRESKPAVLGLVVSASGESAGKCDDRQLSPFDVTDMQK